MKSIPLVVDLDGSLIKTDLLVESFAGLLAQNPLQLLPALAALLRGKAALKARFADLVAIPVESLPYHEPLLSLIRQAREQGREVYLASGSDRRHVEKVAGFLGLFDGVFASDGVTNLTAANKAALLLERFGEGGFDYVGNESADFPVWRHARKAIAISPSAALEARIRRLAAEAEMIGRKERSPLSYLRAMRVHQWLKNLLVFVPPLAAHRFDKALVEGSLTFLSFSLCSSSVYLLNDLLDLASDRTHPTKARRPFASGELPLLHGLVLAPLLLLASLGVALFLPPAFIAVLGGYYALTLGYSLSLKRKMMIDVVTLTSLYGIRLAAGGVAMDVPLSQWLMALSFFLFLCLALVKRCTELIDRGKTGNGDIAGRAYRAADLPILETMAAASGYVAVLVLALYINSPVVTELYRRPQMLWLICVVLVYWVSRILLLTHRGEMHADPVIFAVTDRISLVCGALLAGLMAASI